jgi:hypothetical protein
MERLKGYAPMDVFIKDLKSTERVVQKSFLFQLLDETARKGGSISKSN